AVTPLPGENSKNVVVKKGGRSKLLNFWHWFDGWVAGLLLAYGQTPGMTTAVTPLPGENSKNVVVKKGGRSKLLNFWHWFDG
ncbi:hypothetical protein VS883_28095, partial [Escherichia coli]